MPGMSRLSLSSIVALCLGGSPLSGASLPRCAPGDSLPRPVPTNAVSTLIGLFRRYPVVALGEIHRSAAFHRLLTRLVTAPGFRKAVDDLVVEFGNARYQPLMDRYIRGEKVPPDSIRLVWRNTTQLLVWDSPLYQQFFSLIRAENLRAGKGKQLRVLLGDPPIDWDEVKTTADFPHDYGYRDPDTFRILEEESLSRGRKALIIIGNAHLVRHDPSSDFKPRKLNSAGLGDALTQRYPGKSFLVWSANGGGHGLAEVLSGWTPGTMASLVGTSLGGAGSNILFGDITIFRMVGGKRVPVQLAAADFPPLESQVDATLYLGRASVQVDPPASTYADRAYVAELRRRGDILAPVFGVDVGATLDSLVARAGRGRPARHIPD